MHKQGDKIQELQKELKKTNIMAKPKPNTLILESEKIEKTDSEIVKI